MSTYRLAEAGLRVCLLERGKRYPPGSFARSPREMAANFWDPSGGRHGLFQLWDFGGVEALVSSGLGGGSLIYANVFIRKDEHWFVRERKGSAELEDWPVTRADLDPHYDRVEPMLNLQRYPFDQSPYSETPKTVAFREAAARAGYNWFLPELAVTFADAGQPATPGAPIRSSTGDSTDNLHGRTRYTCRLCGECDVGCNYGSKNTLDYTYLTAAARLSDAAGPLVDIRDHCEVRQFAPRPGGGYWVTYVVHRSESEGRATDTASLPTVTVTCDRLVLSAGTFGSTYLLLRNRRAFKRLSSALGHHFSGNGDLLGFVRGARDGDDPRVLAPSRGPVITSTIRVPDALDGDGRGHGFYVQEGGYPGFVDWLLEATDVPGEVRRAIRFVRRRLEALVQRSPRTNLDAELASLIGDARTSSSVLPLLGMGRDTPDGVFSLRRGRYLALDWTSASSGEYFAAVTASMRRIADELGGDFLINPLWYLRRKVVTVHGLGGCSMGRHSGEGVVDSHGQVFGHPRFYVADGSVMPGPVGPNPSFTIAALADRFADHMVRPLDN